jgi:hypothetical protein
MTAPPPVGHNGGPPLDAPPARKRGRPSSYTPELARIIIRARPAASLMPSISRAWRARFSLSGRL